MIRLTKEQETNPSIIHKFLTPNYTTIIESCELLPAGCNIDSIYKINYKHTHAHTHKHTHTDTHTQMSSNEYQKTHGPYGLDDFRTHAEHSSWKFRLPTL